MVRSAVYGRAVGRPAPAKEAGDVDRRRCPACGGGHTRLVRRTLHHASRTASEVVVCAACWHFWTEPGR